MTKNHIKITKVTQKAFYTWIVTTVIIVAQSIWIYLKHGLNGFQAYTQIGPFTYLPFALASAGLVWLLAGLSLWLIQANKITKANLFSWAGFFIVAASYLNILRERVRYGDIGYYIEAAFAILNHQPFKSDYLYPPLWATLLSFLMPLGEEGILLICWLANISSLFLFYFLLQYILKNHDFTPQAAALTSTIFMMVNMPIMRTLMYVQVNIHVINMIFLGVLLFRKSPFLSALSMALAVHLKASPALLILAFFLEFNWKWFFYFLVNMFLIAMFTVVFYGITPFYDFVNNFLLLNGPRFLSLHDTSFDSAIGMTLSYFRVDFSVVRVLVYFAKGFTALAAIILSLRIRFYSTKTGPDNRLLITLVPLFIAMTIFSPLIWEHHGIFLTLPFLLLIKKLETPNEWVFFAFSYLFVFLVPTFDYYPWSYARLLGILTMLALSWKTQKRLPTDNFIYLNSWISNFIPKKQDSL